MRISSVNANASFKGIKVTLKRKESESSLAREKQRAILDNYKNKAERLEAGICQAKDAKMTSAGVLKSLFFFNKTNPDIPMPIVQPDASIKNAAERETALMDEKAQALLRAIEDIREIDRKQASEVITENNILAENEHRKNTGFSKIVGYDYEKEVLAREFTEPVRREKQGEDLEVFGSILFFGPFNNGKTSITKAVAEETGCNIYIQDVNKEDEIIFSDIKEAAEKSKARFENDRTRTIIFIDEIDNFIDENSKCREEFANFIKTCSKDYHCTVFAATNNPLDLGLNYSDPEIFPIKMSIDPADKETKKGLFKFYTNGFAQDNPDFDEITSFLTEKEEETGCLYSNGQIKNICSEVGLEGKEQKITTSGFIEYVKEHEFDPQITPELAEKFGKDYETLILQGETDED